MPSVKRVAFCEHSRYWAMNQLRDTENMWTSTWPKRAHGKIGTRTNGKRFVFFACFCPNCPWWECPSYHYASYTPLPEPKVRDFRLDTAAVRSRISFLVHFIAPVKGLSLLCLATCAKWVWNTTRLTLCTDVNQHMRHKAGENQDHGVFLAAQRYHVDIPRDQSLLFINGAGTARQQHFLPNSAPPSLSPLMQSDNFQRR